MTTCDPRNKDFKIKQNATGRLANRKFKHVYQFLVPMMDMQVHYWDHERKPAVLPQVMEGNYIWIRSNSWDKDGVCTHLCLFVFAIQRQRRMEIRNSMKWNRVEGVHIGNIISAHWESTIFWLQRKKQFLVQKLAQVKKPKTSHWAAPQVAPRSSHFLAKNGALNLPVMCPSTEMKTGGLTGV